MIERGELIDRLEHLAEAARAGWAATADTAERMIIRAFDDIKEENKRLSEGAKLKEPCGEDDDSTGRHDATEHYANGGRVETIDVIAQLGWLEDFCRGNVLKYLTRYKHKGGEADLRKAIRYIEFMIEHEYDDTKEAT